MRNTLYLISIIAITVLLAANTTIQNNFMDQFDLFGEVKWPVLPAEHFEYELQDLPDHLFDLTTTTTTTSSGWGTTSTSTSTNSPFNNITNEIATLGRVLFYDELLSANNNIACATCHIQEKSFADDTPFSDGVSFPTDVNSMHLNDLGWSNNAGFFWDMSQSDLVESIALPLTNPNEIGVTNPDGLVEIIRGTPYYTKLFQDAYGGTIVNYARIRLALAQFISSMNTFNSKFDRVQNGTENYTQIEKLGENLFIENCSICHADGTSIFLEDFLNFPDESSAVSEAPFLFDNGLPLKAGDLGAGAWDENFRGLFKAPTLRNIEKTGPYMHDGRFETLEAVIDHYSEGISNSVSQWNNPVPLPPGGFDFSPKEKAALVYFLKSLTDHEFLADEKFSDPFQLFELEDIEENIVEEEVEEEDNFPVRVQSVVYPNPTIETLNIGFENLNKRLVKVYLMDVNGKVVRKLSSHQKGISTDVSLLPRGIYTVRVMKRENVWDDHQVILQ